MQRTVRTAHLSVLMTVHNTAQNSSDNLLLPPDNHYSSDVVYRRRRGYLHSCSHLDISAASTVIINSCAYWSFSSSLRHVILTVTVCVGSRW